MCERLETILDHFIERNMDIRWQCLARVDRVNPELLAKMYQAGCRQIHYGIESGNEEVLKRTAKHIRLDQVSDAVRWTEAAGIQSKGYFILGLPGDTEETMEETIEFAAGLELTDAMFSIATPMPGTPLWSELLRKRPGTAYNADFTKSYYYNSYTAEIAPFMNVSEVGDERVERDGAQGPPAFPGSQETAHVPPELRRYSRRSALECFAGYADSQGWQRLGQSWPFRQLPPHQKILFRRSILELARTRKLNSSLTRAYG